LNVQAVLQLFIGRLASLDLHHSESRRHSYVALGDPFAFFVLLESITGEVRRRVLRALLCHSRESQPNGKPHDQYTPACSLLHDPPRYNRGTAHREGIMPNDVVDI